MKNTYSYNGPVKCFDTIVANNWHAKTTAGSRRAALKNLTFRFNTETGYIPARRLTFDQEHLTLEGNTNA